MTVLQFTVVKGHQVASGSANDPRFPHGTITAQLPFFYALGLNLDGFYQGTINAEFNCDDIVLNHYDYQFKQVKWHSKIPAEDFRFCRCHILAKNQSYPALIYQPMKTTKTEHFQAKNQLELLAPFISDVKYGDSLALDITNSAITMNYF